jgi:predicted glycosyltransferase
MKIWIDFINTPQVTFFVPFINEFKSDEHEILLTCRDSGNTIDLLKQQGLPFRVIGDKAGKGFLQKALFFPNRVLRLLNYIRKEKPEIAVSQSSFYQPIVAKLLGIPCLYTNDNEHAKGNLFGFLFAGKVLLPVALENMPFTKRFPVRKKLSYYPSVKEAIYLSQNPGLLALASGNKNKIYFRPEPWSAQYYDGPLNFFDDILLKLAGKYNVVVLPRDRNQVVHYNQPKFGNLAVAKKALDLSAIISDCLLFIGAGGSMTREMAVMEVPVISIYQSDLLCVDRYLIDRGLMKINPEITFEEITSFLESDSKPGREWKVLNEGRSSYSIIKNQIYNLYNE